jgi:hypothetical protein
MHASLTPGQTKPLVMSREPGDKTLYVYSPEDRGVGAIIPRQPIDLFIRIKSQVAGYSTEKVVPLPHYGLKMSMVNDETDVSVYYRPRPILPGLLFPAYTVYGEIVEGTDDFQLCQASFMDYYNARVGYQIFPTWGGVLSGALYIHKIPPYVSEYRVTSDCHGRIVWCEITGVREVDYVDMSIYPGWRQINRMASHYRGWINAVGESRTGSVLLEFR